MTPSHPTSRRRFLGSSAALALAPLFGQSAENKKEANLERYEFCTFTKALQGLPQDEMAKTLAKMGYQGIEAAVRAKGQVEPERVEEDLPKLIEVLKAHGLVLSVMTTSINEVSKEQETEKVLRTAAALGVKRFRMGYYRYDLNRPILPQLDEFRPRLRELVAFAREVGIKPVYQNHSGKDYFGAPIWDLATTLEPYSPEDVGVAFDIGHATVEGGKAWRLNFATIRPWIDTVYLKEPYLEDNKIGWGPLGEGAVDKQFYKVLKESDFRGPVSVHVEYLGHGDGVDIAAVIAAIQKDLGTARALLS